MDDQTLFTLMVGLHRDGTPQGPGSDEETLRALELTRLDRAAGLHRLLTLSAAVRALQPWRWRVGFQAPESLPSICFPSFSTSLRSERVQQVVPNRLKPSRNRWIHFRLRLNPWTSSGPRTLSTTWASARASKPGGRFCDQAVWWYMPGYR